MERMKNGFDREKNEPILMKSRSIVVFPIQVLHKMQIKTNQIQILVDLSLG